MEGKLLEVSDEDIKFLQLAVAGLITDSIAVCKHFPGLNKQFEADEAKLNNLLGRLTKLETSK